MKRASRGKRRRVCKRSQKGAKWITHYCIDHKILLVGEGDFSFSLSLAKAFASATNIVASSLDTYDDVIKKYKHAKSNLDALKKLGACLLHGVDATKMKYHSHLNMRRFDRIIFNFPHAGFHRKEDNLLMIKMHKDLVFGFFKNASGMLMANGEIHVNHKTKPPFTYWNIENLAIHNFLTLIECSDFNKEDYPGYNNKRGDGNRCDKPFHLGKCSTFKFIITPFRRTMAIAPFISPCARNEGYKYQVFEGNSRYLEREICRSPRRLYTQTRSQTHDTNRVCAEMLPRASQQNFDSWNHVRVHESERNFNNLDFYRTRLNYFERYNDEVSWMSNETKRDFNNLSFDRTRFNYFERCNDEVPWRRSLNTEMHVVYNGEVVVPRRSN